MNPEKDRPIIRAMRKSPAGFVMRSGSYDDLQVLKLQMPGPGSGQSLPPGHGFFGMRGKISKVKVAVPDLD